MVSRYYANEQALIQLGHSLACAPLAGNCIYLYGDLGVGKTTLVRAVLKALGALEPIPSPTYTLVQSYADLTPAMYHLDLYRLESPFELDEIGVEDYFQTDSCVWVEWPDKGLGVLPNPDLVITIKEHMEGRHVEIDARSPSGHLITVNL